MVDDEVSIRSLVRGILESTGFDVMEAKDGREGLEVFQKHMDTIRLVVLDMTMPYMQGDEVFREMRNLKEDVKVILSSGYNKQEIISHFNGKGTGAFIQKPYQAQQLIDLVHTTLDPRNNKKSRT